MFHINYYHNTETQLGVFFDLLSRQADTSNNKEAPNPKGRRIVKKQLGVRGESGGDGVENFKFALV